MGRFEIVDEEFDKAMNSKETPKYYRVSMSNGGECIKLYKPSVANLLSKRTGKKMVMIHSEPKKHAKKVDKKPFWL